MDKGWPFLIPVIVFALILFSQANISVNTPDSTPKVVSLKNIPASFTIRLVTMPRYNEFHISGTTTDGKWRIYTMRSDGKIWSVFSLEYPHQAEQP